MLREQTTGKTGWRWAWVAVVTMAAAGVTASGCESGKASQTAPARPPQAALVTLAPAVNKPMPRAITTFGQSRSQESVSVRALVTEALREVHFEKGQAVTKGQVLFTIDSQSFETALTRAEATLERVQSNLKRAQASRDRATSTLDGAKAKLDGDNAQLKLQSDTLAKVKELFDSGFAKQNEVDNAQAAVDSAAAVVRADEAAINTAQADISTSEADLLTAQADIRTSEADIAKAKLDLQYCVITSPLDGVVGDVLMTPGNVVKANDTVLVVINQISPIEVVFAVPEAQLATVRKYNKAGGLSVQAQAAGAEAQTGQLIFIDNQVDASTGTVKMAATFDNESGELWPGQFVRVALTLAMDHDAIVVPSKALQTGRSGKFVFVVKDNTASVRPVTVLQTAGSDTVVQGVESGEMVVTDGQMSLVDGASVRLREDRK